MPLKQLGTRCWVIAYPDGKLDSRWDERHFSDEEIAADALWDEMEREASDGDPSATELPAACFIVVCDGCGEEYGWEEGSTDHFVGPSDAAWHSGDAEFRKDGTTWCENCRSWADPEAAPTAPSSTETV